jgi:broad specificity phosphatase PhoE
MIQIILARHAQTTANVELWISGWRNDVDLTHEGVDHAYEMGRRLKSKFFVDENPASESNSKPVAILCSDLTRAKHTAELVNHSLNLPVEYHAGLRERNYGEWTGRKYADLGNDPKDWQQAKHDPNQPLWHNEDWSPPGGETLATFRQRAVSAIEHGIQLWDGQKFIVIAHRGTIRALLQRHMSVEYQETPSPPNPPEFLEIEWSLSNK